MINIHFEFTNQSLDVLRVEGHQLSHDAGQSFGVVCNSVSVTVQNFQEAVLKLVGNTEFEFRNDKGLCSVTRRNVHRLEDKKENILDILVKVSLIGFKRLEKHHPEHISVNIREK
ncbi:MAG: ribosomal-processing cysteine protease Prp [bacterium]|nr:ribosomal-processing cysteine protease Prp [bacterium]